MTDEELDALLDELEAALLADVQAALALTAQEFAEALDGATELVAARFSVSGIKDMWKRRVGSIMDRLKAITSRAGQVTADDLGDELPDGWDDQLTDYVTATQALLDAVGDRLAAEASQALAEGLNAGEDVDQLRARLAALFAEDGTQLGASRADRIATTEATRAWNAGTLAAAQALTGPDRPLVKQWVTRMDARVRDAHRDTNGQLQLLDDPFDVTGVPMQYPGDPTAPAALTVGCRCILRTATAPERTDDVSEGDDLSAAADVHTGAMIALMPTEEDAARLALDGGEAADQLHLTLYYLGDAVDWTERQRGDLISRVAAAARYLLPIGGRAFGSAQWNPASDEPAWVWNVGNDNDAPGSTLEDAKYEITYALEDGYDDPQLPQQYTPWSPHICAVYSQDEWHQQMAEQVGPVTFDRVRVAFAGQYTDIPLTGAAIGTLADNQMLEPMPVEQGYVLGDRVRVAGEPHEAGHDTGTVEEVSDGPAYGIVFDGMEDMGVHKWYVEEELVPEGAQAAEPIGYVDVPYEQPPQIVTWSTPGAYALAFENQQTGDGRVFTPGALYWEGDQWPLQYADEMNGGHDGARLAGAIYAMDREGDRIPGYGVLYLTQSAGAESAMLLAQGAPLGVSVDLDDVDMQLVDASGGSGYDLAASTYSAYLATASLLPLPDGGWRLTGETEQHWTASGSGTVGESSRIDIVVGADGRVPAAAFEVTAAAGDSGEGGVVVEEQHSGDFLVRITKARVRGATLVSIPAYSDARIVLDNPSMFASAGEASTLTAAAASATSPYDRTVRHVRKALIPVTAGDAAAFLHLPVSDVRRYLARAAKKGHVVRIAHGRYVRQQDATAAATNELADLDELFASFTDDLDTDGTMTEQLTASVWSAMKDLPPMPAAWFAEPTADELPPGGPGVNYKDGRVFGWVAQAGEPHAGFAKKVTIDGLGRIDTTHFLRQPFTLDNGAVVKAGAFTMNVGHHRDSAECETSACQFDNSRTVAGIVTVGMSDRGMWFSGAAAPWLSEWDRSVFMATQPSYHMKKGPSGNWQLRAVLAVPVPGHSSPLLASAVVDRSNLALTAAATMAEVEDAVTAAERAAADELTQHDQQNGHYPQGIDYDRLADSLVAAMVRADERKAAEAAELEALLAEGRKIGGDTGTVEGN